MYVCVFQNLTLGPEAKIEATMQHEITRLTSENLVKRNLFAYTGLINHCTPKCKQDILFDAICPDLTIHIQGSAISNKPLF